MAISKRRSAPIKGCRDLIANGSLMELETQVQIAKRLGYVSSIPDTSFTPLNT